MTTGDAAVPLITGGVQYGRNGQAREACAAQGCRKDRLPIKHRLGKRKYRCFDFAFFETRPDVNVVHLFIDSIKQVFVLKSHICLDRCYDFEGEIFLL
jgi:hypothetical protein